MQYREQNRAYRDGLHEGREASWRCFRSMLRTSSARGELAVRARIVTDWLKRPHQTRNGKAAEKRLFVHARSQADNQNQENTDHGG